MEKAIRWTKHLIEEVARRRHTNPLECGQELRVLMAIAAGEKTYEVGDLEELTYILTGKRPEAVMSLDAGIATESQIAVRAHKVADAIRKFENACEIDKSASRRFKRLVTGAEPVQNGAGVRLVENLHVLCDYLQVERPEVEPHEVKPFLQAVTGAMPRPRNSDQATP